MIIFASPTKPFICTPLGSSLVNRRDTLAEYNGEIDTLYKTIARAAHMALNPPKIWSPKNSLVYVRGIIVVVLGKKLDDNADFFQHGTDRYEPFNLSDMSLDLPSQSTSDAYPYHSLPCSPKHREDGHPKALR